MVDCPGQAGAFGIALTDERVADLAFLLREEDRKSTRLNSSHSQISYAVFCLKKKNKRRASTFRCGAVIFHDSPGLFLGAQVRNNPDRRRWVASRVSQLLTPTRFPLNRTILSA